MNERALSADEQLELEAQIADGLELIGKLVKDSDDPIGSIRQCIDVVRTGRASPELGDRERLAYLIGALFGDEVRRQLGWQWVMLLEGGSELPAVVPVDRAFALRPQLSVYRLLFWPKSDNTVGLLFNQLRELPPAEPGSYSLLG